MVLSDFMLEAFGMLSSESTKKDLLAFVLIYSLLLVVCFFTFYMIIFAVFFFK
jgi:type IV secretory pathway TrbL component